MSKKSVRLSVNVAKSVYGKGHGVFPAARRRLMRLIMAIRMKVSLEAGSGS